jgi:penicillin-binding protein 2
MMTDSRRLALRRQRGRIALAGLGLVLFVLLATFFRLQILRSSQYLLRSDENRLRAIGVVAPRGTIYDRNGLVVAENVPGYVISLLPGPADTIAASLSRLKPYLGIDTEEEQDLLEKNRARPNDPLVLRDNASFEQVSFIEQRRPDFRRVVVEMRPRRHYPSGQAIAHLIGYVGEISEQELEQPQYAEYEPGRVIGKDGLERQYESHLAGDPGVRYVEVNALGSVVREFDRALGDPADPGQDLQLGIDLGLQVLADSIFPEGMRGGVVAIEPRTGEVLLLYSKPSFDPNRFVGGIPTELWNSLRDDPDKPLLNRVTGSAYPPGSTWKLVMATVGMNTGALAIDSYMPNVCSGALAYGNRTFHCWRPGGHGSLDLSGAIKESCNVFFYQAGQRIGLDALTAGVTNLGYNERTGIDLPYETPGLFPESREWFDQRYGQRGWTESVVWNLAIGQGENQQTLLRQALFYAALATGEPPIQPHLARSEVLAAQQASWRLDLPEGQREGLVDAMIRVANEPRGTAYAHRLEQWTLAGKTGTAQNPHGEPHSWFVGFAPARNPRIVIAAIVEQGHPDGTTSLAVPLSSSLVGRYLESIELPPEPARVEVVVASPPREPSP